MEKIKKIYNLNKEVVSQFQYVVKVNKGTMSGVVEKMMIDYITDFKYKTIKNEK